MECANLSLLESNHVCLSCRFPLPIESVTRVGCTTPSVRCGIQGVRGRPLSTQLPCGKQANFAQHLSMIGVCLVLKLRPVPTDRSDPKTRLIVIGTSLVHCPQQLLVRFCRHRTKARPSSECGQHSFRNTKLVVLLLCVGSRTCIFQLCHWSSCSKFFCKDSLTHTCASRGICLGLSAQCHLLHACKSSQMGKKPHRRDSSSVHTSVANTS